MIIVVLVRMLTFKAPSVLLALLRESKRAAAMRPFVLYFVRFHD